MMNEPKIALIFGGTGGIGSATARLFCSKGMKVYATYHHSPAVAQKIQAELKDITFLKCDASNEQEVSAVIGQITKECQRIDVVVNAVTSPLKLKPFDRLSADEISEDINTILWGGINIFRQVVPVMKRTMSGTIISIITSAVAGSPPARMSSYIAAKAGLAGLSNSLASELSPYNIRIVSISPSFVETKLISAFPEKLIEIEREKQPDKQFLKPEDIALCVFSAVSDLQKYPNGANVVIRSRKDI